MITQQELKQLLDYNPETGEFTWKVTQSNKAKAGNKTGYLNPDKYWVIMLNGKSYRAHRLAWLYVHGYMPKKVDHINNIRHDNRLCNLRPATDKESAANKLAHKDNTSGYKGVYWNKHAEKWHAKCKNESLGYFDTPEEAAKAYNIKATELFGEYAKLNQF